jgi:hypothetical protein
MKAPRWFAYKALELELASALVSALASVLASALVSALVSESESESESELVSESALVSGSAQLQLLRSRMARAN